MHHEGDLQHMTALLSVLTIRCVAGELAVVESATVAEVHPSNWQAVADALSEYLPATHSAFDSRRLIGISQENLPTILLKKTVEKAKLAWPWSSTRGITAGRVFAPLRLLARSKRDYAEIWRLTAANEQRTDMDPILETRGCGREVSDIALDDQWFLVAMTGRHDWQVQIFNHTTAESDAEHCHTVGSSQWNSTQNSVLALCPPRFAVTSHEAVNVFELPNKKLFRIDTPASQTGLVCVMSRDKLVVSYDRHIDVYDYRWASSQSADTVERIRTHSKAVANTQDRKHQLEFAVRAEGLAHGSLESTKGRVEELEEELAQTRRDLLEQKTAVKKASAATKAAEKALASAQRKLQEIDDSESAATGASKQ